MKRLAVAGVILAVGLAGCERDPVQPFEVPTGTFRSATMIAPGEMIDLGTLGGQWSEARGINQAGQVVGVAMTANQDQRAFLWTEADGMRDLGYVMEPYRVSAANDINDRGQVVGWSYVLEGGVASQRAMIWSEAEGMRALPLLSDGCANPSSEAVAINNHGEAVGYSTGADCYYYAVHWDADGTPTDLGGGLGSFATDINDRGRVTGFNSSVNLTGFTWTRGEGYRRLPGYHGFAAYPYGINEREQIAGGSGAVGGVMWPSPTEDPIPLRALMEGLGSQGEAINEQSHIAGWSYLIGPCGGGACRRAVFWSTAEEPLHLGTLEGGLNSYANDLNERAQVVGWSDVEAGRRAFIYQVPVTPPNDPPYFIHPADGTRFQFTAGSEGVFGVRAADPNPDDVVALGVENLPPGASFPIPAPANPVESVFRWRPTPEQVGEHRVTFTATDNHGESTSVTVIVEVIPAEPPPPPPCNPPGLQLAAWSGQRAPGTISLGDAEVHVLVFNVEPHIPPQNPRPRPGDLRFGAQWETATPAEAFRVLDADNDGNRDVQLRFDMQRLVNEGNLSAGSQEVTIWGRNPVTEERFCGRATVNVVP